MPHFTTIIFTFNLPLEILAPATVTLSQVMRSKDSYQPLTLHTRIDKARLREENVDSSRFLWARR